MVLVGVIHESSSCLILQVIVYNGEKKRLGGMLYLVTLMVGISSVLGHTIADTRWPRQVTGR